MNMKKIGIQMSLLMGITLSFCLSLIGNLTSGHFTIPGFLISFVLSTVISLIIGFLVPMKKVGDSVTAKLGLRPHSLPAHAVESLVSDLIYTPVITLAMVTLAYFMMQAPEKPPFLPMFLSSLLISMLAGYVLIFFLMPLFMKLVFKKNGVPMGGPPAGAPGNAPGVPGAPAGRPPEKK